MSANIPPFKEMIFGYFRTTFMTRPKDEKRCVIQDMRHFATFLLLLLFISLSFKIFFFTFLWSILSFNMSPRIEQYERFFPPLNFSVFFYIITSLLCVLFVPLSSMREKRNPKSFNSFENSVELYVFGRSLWKKLFWEFLLEIIIKTNRSLFNSQCCFETSFPVYIFFLCYAFCWDHIISKLYIVKSEVKLVWRWKRESETEKTKNISASSWEDGKFTREMMRREQLFELKFMKINPEELLYRIGIPISIVTRTPLLSSLSFISSK